MISNDEISVLLAYMVAKNARYKAQDSKQLINPFRIHSSGYWTAQNFRNDSNSDRAQLKIAARLLWQSASRQETIYCASKLEDCKI